MQIHTLLTLDAPDDRNGDALSHHTTREGAERALVALALDGKVTGKVAIRAVNVEGDPVVTVLVDDDDKLVAGPFTSRIEADSYSPAEDLDVVEWTVDRYAEALAALRVEQAHLRLAVTGGTV